jgi:hypothetical protein
MGQISLIGNGILSAVFLLCAAGCARPDTPGDKIIEWGSGGAGGSAGSGGTTGPDLGQPPEPPKEGGPGDGPGAVFAISSVRLGATHPDGVSSEIAWRQYGYNLDHTVTWEKSGPITCKPLKGAKPSYAADGRDGIDNAFGSHVLPLVSSLSTKTEQQSNDAIQGGGPTLLVSLADLGEAPSYTSINAYVYDGAPLLAAPKWDGSDVFPVAFESVNEGDIAAPLLQMKDSYLVADGDGGTWVGRGDGFVLVRVAMGETLHETIHIAVHSPLLTMHFAADRTRATGILSGLIDLQELIPELIRAMGLFDLDLCPPSSFLESILAEITQAADIRHDGLIDPEAPCTATSLGIGFEAELVQLGAVAPAAKPLPESCHP